MELVLPSKGSIVYRHQSGDKKFRRFTNRLNSFVIFLYRINFLPLFGVGKKLIILKTVGRKTGKIRRRPVLHKILYTNKMTLYCARGKNADWLKNIFAAENQVIKIQKGFRRMLVKATLVEPEEEKYKHLIYWCEKFKDAKNLFGYDKEEHGDIFETEEFMKLVRMLEFIQLEPI
ncbi:MAG: nitroreductase family deazaflavin-dependent oxidoreductase [Candidatus Heimdallarchaeota archaeon]|nr:nitroreductase family deazaflavin-dependent oxidoreductase [Candidatus Heimdallarchaeota archaeon]